MTSAPPEWYNVLVDHPTDWLLVLFNGILALFTAGLYRATSGLWKASQEQAIDLRRSIKAAEEAARATEASVRTMEQNAERELRAYVFVAEVRITGIDGPEPCADIFIRNTGKTPAYNATCSTRAKGFTLPSDIQFETAMIGPDSSRFVLGPDSPGRRTVQLKTILSQYGAVESIRFGLSVLYLWGEILYEDALKHDRYTRFRFEIGGKAGWPSDDRMVVSPEGNEAS